MLCFFQPPRQDITSLASPGYARLGKIDFQCPVRAARTSLRLVPCLENMIVHGEVAFDAARFRISPVFPKRKAFADIHRNVGLVRSVMIQQRRF